jgi:hypothetical protein
MIELTFHALCFGAILFLMMCLAVAIMLMFVGPQKFNESKSWGYAYLVGFILSSCVIIYFGYYKEASALDYKLVLDTKNSTLSRRTKDYIFDALTDGKLTLFEFYKIRMSDREFYSTLEFDQAKKALLK